SLYFSNYLNPVTVKKLMKYYIWITAAVMFFCLVMASYKYFNLADRDGFFYHALVSPFRQNAVQVSILLFVGLVYLAETTGREFYFNNKPLHFFLIFYYVLCIVLLSSKLVIIFLSCYFIYFFIILLRKKKPYLQIAT